MRLRSIVPALFLIGLIPTAARAAAATIEDPGYLAWKRVPPGSTATSETMITAPDGRKASVVQTETLEAIDESGAAVAIVTAVVDSNNRLVGTPATKRFRVDRNVLKPTELPFEEVEYKGRKLHCRVYRTDGIAEFPGSMLTIYYNDEIPGGRVKYLLTKADGQTQTSLLTDYHIAATKVEHSLYRAWKPFKRFAEAMYESEPGSAAALRVFRKLDWLDDKYIGMTTTTFRIQPDGKAGRMTQSKIRIDRYTAAPPEEALPDEDVPYHGRTLHCRVVRQASFGEGETDGVTTSWLNDEVPGGQVKSSFVHGNDKPVVLHLVSTYVSDGMTESQSPPRVTNLSPTPGFPAGMTFSANAPDGWIERSTAFGGKGIVKIYIAGSDSSLDWRTATGVITIEAGNLTDGPEDAIAKSIAGADGRILPSRRPVDGTEAYIVNTPSSDLGRPRIAAVMPKNGRVYIVSVFGRDESVEEAFDGMLARWKWSGSQPDMGFDPRFGPPPGMTGRPTTRPMIGGRMSTTRPRRTPATLPTINAADSVAQLKAIDTHWQPSKGKATDLLSLMTGGTRDAITKDADGVLVDRGQTLLSTGKFRAPVTFRIVLLNATTDLRLGFAADQVIFNWEMRPDELRVDGGPVSGRHKPGVGRLPTGKWTGVEWVVTTDQMVLFIDGREVYRERGDFSKVERPFSIRSHTGLTRVKAVTVVQ